MFVLTYICEVIVWYWCWNEPSKSRSVRSSADQLMQFCGSEPIQYRIIITYQCTYTHQYHEKSDIMK